MRSKVHPPEGLKQTRFHLWWCKEIYMWVLQETVKAGVISENVVEEGENDTGRI